MGFFSSKKGDDKERQAESLGLGMPPGGEHYRAFVGPPEDYDLVSAMTFNLLTTLGLRQHHSVLDIGCGSLRIGRLMIPYLNAGNYTGIEPNGWLVEEGIQREIGHDLVEIKRPNLHVSDTATSLPQDQRFDFAFAQSIFSHCGPDLFAKWLGEIAPRLGDAGALVATILTADTDCEELGWIYPGCVYYKLESVAAMAEKASLQFLALDWKHPRQRWVLFYKQGFDVSWIQNGHLTWNAMMSRMVAA
jgi:SAM-dependent methyltransferase